MKNLFIDLRYFWLDLWFEIKLWSEKVKRLIFFGLLLTAISCVQLAAQTMCDSSTFVQEVFNRQKLTDSTRFAPVFRNGVPDQYQFEIRNSWGELVFKTDIQEQGWNGLRNNRKGMCANGTYMWILFCRWSKDSIELNCSGFVLCSNMNAEKSVTALDTIECHPGIYVPNTITPNGDGLNEYFTPIFGCLPAEYEMWIFDRWGNTIFSTKDVNRGWDGRDASGSNLQTDVYVWKIKCKFYDGDKLRQHVGHVTLIR